MLLCVININVKINIFMNLNAQNDGVRVAHVLCSKATNSFSSLRRHPRGDGGNNSRKINQNHSLKPRTTDLHEAHHVLGFYSSD